MQPQTEREGISTKKKAAGLRDQGRRPRNRGESFSRPQFGEGFDNLVDASRASVNLIKEKLAALSYRF
jgi:hypothetical protein